MYTTLLHTTGRRAAGLVVCACLLLAGMAASILYGATQFDAATAWQSIASYDSAVKEQVVIRTTRVPRALIAVAVGASLAVAGALMQALTRNPLASPGVLGINAGATLFIVAGVLLFNVSDKLALMWLAFGGAALSAVIVYGLGAVGRDMLTPMRIVMAGAAVTALFASCTQGLLVTNRQGLNTVLFWLTGSIAGRSVELLIAVWPYMLGSMALAWYLARELNLLAMGESVAKGIGQRIGAVKWTIGGLVVVLAGASVSVAGPIGFIGVVIPHIGRWLVGHDHRWLLPYCALLGALLLVAADVAARFVLPLEEIPVGVMTAIVGGPFFVHLARKGLSAK